MNLGFKTEKVGSMIKFNLVSETFGLVSQIRKLYKRCFKCLICLCWLPFAISCGGKDPTPIKDPTIVGSNLFYNTYALFSVGVNDLNQGITFSADLCGPMIQVLSSNPLYIQFRCKINATGTMTFVANDPHGLAIVSKAFTVPLPQVKMDLDQGSILMEFYPNQSPISVNNFLQYVSDGFYNGIIFHRTVPGFVIQAGGFTPGMVPKSSNNPSIALESQNGLSNLTGTVAMARTADPNSANSQFYINLVDNKSLDFVDINNPGYAVFGKVVNGFDLVTSISNVSTSSVNGFTNVPSPEITIRGMTRLQ